jgi:sulfoxide reductase heme-binding subunit YedZ
MSLDSHIWWLASRASGLIALALITISVGLGLAMAGRLMRRPGRARVMTALHEQTALAGLVAIAIHGITLLGDGFLSPGLTGIAVPGAIDYRPVWTGLGIGAGYLAAALGLSFYFRKRIGPRIWRRAHRATIVVYALAVLHTLGAGSDASTPWLRAWMALTVPPIAILFAIRLTARWRSRRRPERGAGSAGPAGAAISPRGPSSRPEVSGGVA